MTLEWVWGWIFTVVAWGVTAAVVAVILFVIGVALFAVYAVLKELIERPAAQTRCCGNDKPRGREK